jgi:ATP-binding cassette subfamily F protein 3
MPSVLFSTRLSMLSSHQISKSYGVHTVLNNITFSINTGDRIGLIGPNGCGKSTLLRIIIGTEKPDTGIVTHTRTDLKLGYLPQGFDLNPDLTFAQAINLEGSTDSDRRLLELAARLAANPADRKLQADYDAIIHQVSITRYPQEILFSLGLADIDKNKLVGSLSGGQKTRLLLARLLMDEPNLVLLDEPTNHLDIAMLEWLEAWLNHFRGAALIVSHDRAFLDNTVRRILDLNPDTHSIHEYPGNFSEYLDQFLAEKKNQWDEYRDQVTEIHRMKQDINRTKQQALNVERTTTSRQPGVRRYAKKVAQKALSRQKKLDRYLQSDERVEKPLPGWQLKLDFSAPKHLSHDVLICDKLSIGYQDCSPLLQGVNLIIHGGERVVLTGPNGCGKTTFLRTIHGDLEPIAGSIRLGGAVKLGYMTQEQENLDLNKTPLETIQAVGFFDQTEARHFLHFFLFEGDDPLRPAGSLSYGERTRLELALLVARGCTFLLLDEPINHLDIPSRARFEQSLDKFNGTVLAVIHDRYFIERYATKTWSVEGSGIRQF